jgi:hypothetical protein
MLLLGNPAHARTVCIYARMSFPTAGYNPAQKPKPKPKPGGALVVFVPGRLPPAPPPPRATDMLHAPQRSCFFLGAIVFAEAESCVFPVDMDMKPTKNCISHMPALARPGGGGG